MALDRELLEEFGRKAAELLNNNPLKANGETQLRALAMNTLDKLGAVSRAEFDAQVEVLKRSREKIDALEQQLAVLIDQQEIR